MPVPDFGAFPIEPRGLAPGLDEGFTPTTRAAPPDPGHDPTVTRLRIWRLGVRIPRGAPPTPLVGGPVAESLTRQVAGLRLSRDPVAGHSQHDWDHLRPLRNSTCRARRP